MPFRIDIKGKNTTCGCLWSFMAPSTSRGMSKLALNDVTISLVFKRYVKGMLSKFKLRREKEERLTEFFLVEKGERSLKEDEGSRTEGG